MTNISFMLYGEPGTGKTVLASTSLAVPELTPVLMIDKECNTLSINSKITTIDRTGISKPVKDKINRIIVRSTDDIEFIVNWLMNNQEVYKCVIVDSLTEISSMYLNELAWEKHQKVSKLSVKAPEIQHYGANLLFVKQLVNWLKLLPAVIIYTALEDIDKIEGELVYKVRPDFAGKLSREVTALLSIVGRLSVKNAQGIREMRFQPDSRISAKDQSENGTLGLVMDNPTFPKIMEKLGLTAIQG